MSIPQLSIGDEIGFVIASFELDEPDGIGWRTVTEVTEEGYAVKLPDGSTSHIPKSVLTTPTYRVRTNVEIIERMAA